MPNLYITSISKDAIYMVVRSESILLWAEQSTKKKNTHSRNYSSRKKQLSTATIRPN